MSHGVVAKRTDWLLAQYQGGPMSPNPALHEVIGNLAGYQGALSQHGEYCNRFQWASAPPPESIWRYLHVDQRDDDDKACDVQAAFINEGFYAQAYCGLVVKAQSGCSLYDVVCVAKAGLGNGDYFTLLQTVAPTATINFWFDVTGTYPGPPYDATNVRVDVSAATTAEDVAAAIRSAIQSVQSSLRMVAERPGVPSSTVRVMRTEAGSTAGDTPTENVSDPGFVVTKVSDGAPGTVESSTVGGYVLTYWPTNNRYVLSRARTVWNQSNGGVYADVGAAPTAAKRWMGLRLTAIRLGDDIRLRGYALSGYAAVDTMFNNPSWVPVIDVVHQNGFDVPVVVPISGVVQNVSAGFVNGTPSLTGRCGFAAHKAGGGNTQFYLSSPRILRAVPA